MIQLTSNQFLLKENKKKSFLGRTISLIRSEDQIIDWSFIFEFLTLLLQKVSSVKNRKRGSEESNNLIGTIYFLRNSLVLFYI